MAEQGVSLTAWPWAVPSAQNKKGVMRSGKYQTSYVVEGDEPEAASDWFWDDIIAEAVGEGRYKTEEEAAKAYRGYTRFLPCVNK